MIHDTSEFLIGKNGNCSMSQEEVLVQESALPSYSYHDQQEEEAP